MTKQAFLETYRRLIVAKYEWAKDQAKLERFMASVATTLEGPTSPWAFEGETTTEAWRAIGGKGKPTRKALRALS